MSTMPIDGTPPPLKVPVVFLFALTPGSTPGVLFRLVRSVQELLEVDAGRGVAFAQLVLVDAAVKVVTVPLLPDPVAGALKILEAGRGHVVLHTPGPQLWHTLFHWVKAKQRDCPPVPALPDLVEAVCGPAILSLADRKDFDPARALKLCGVSELMPGLREASVLDQPAVWITLAKHLIL